MRDPRLAEKCVRERIRVRDGAMREHPLAGGDVPAYIAVAKNVVLGAEQEGDTKREDRDDDGIARPVGLRGDLGLRVMRTVVVRI